MDKVMEGGATPMYIAAKEGNARVLQLLVDAGADAQSALHHANHVTYNQEVADHLKNLVALTPGGHGEQERWCRRPRGAET